MTALVLNPVAVSSAGLLRAIRAGQWSTKAELATAAGRNPSNIARDLAILRTADLLADGDTVALSVNGSEQLEAIERAEGKPGLPGGERWPQQVGDIRLLMHSQIVADPENARQDWESEEAREELDALREDIIQVGLLQNLVVRAGPDDTFILVGGERRWRAIGLAISDDDWPLDRPIPCRVIDADELGHRLAALSENLQRRNLNPLEKARAFEGLAQAFAEQGVEDGKINREIADRIGVTIEHVQQHRSFMKLDEADQQRLTLAKDDPRRMSVSDARKKLSAKKEAALEVEFDPETRLLLAEILHAVRARTTYTYADLQVGPAAREDDRLAPLVAQGQLRFDPDPEQYGELAGHIVIALGYQFAFGAFDWSADPDPEARDAGLVVEWDRSGHARPDGAYLTEWLNPPFDITPEGQAIIDQRAADEAAKEESTAENIRIREAAEVARAADIVRQAEVAARSRDLFAAHRRAAPKPADVVTLAEEAESPLPWRITHKGDVVAADGSLVIGGRTNDRAEARMRLLVLALNTVGGVETPEDEPAPEPEAQPADAFDEADA
jgi:ParB/RepB/Spo0J family partition protein